MGGKGEQAFWNGIRLFTRRHFGKSVVTIDFVAAMEEANGKSLKEFFAKWVYLRSRILIAARCFQHGGPGKTSIHGAIQTVKP